MKKTWITITFSACLLLAIIGCTKPDDAKITPISNNVLCDGNGSTFFYPMTLKNNWTYIIKSKGVVQTKEAKLEVPQMQTIFIKKTYFVMADSQSNM